MPWDDGDHAGFSSVEPWLPLNPDWRTRNVAAQEGDPASMLSLYRRLLSLRRAEPALAVGAFDLLEAPEGVLAYSRKEGERTLRILLNLTDQPRTIEWSGDVLLSTLDSRPQPGSLQPNEGLILA
jgi:oligo-1,6-glucosidase/alpha-glucosidase